MPVGCAKRIAVQRRPDRIKARAALNRIVDAGNEENIRTAAAHHRVGIARLARLGAGAVINCVIAVTRGRNDVIARATDQGVVAAIALNGVVA